MSEPTRAAISYAHGPHDREVLALADRLNREGVDCEVDAYDTAPPEGWPRWMERMMTQRTVLVVASEPYYRRHQRAEPVGIGLGSTFETGLLAQRVVEMQGKNEGIIPVLLDADDAQFIPPFLKGVTLYDLTKPDGYESLYRRLTGQPKFVKPPLGEVRILPIENQGGVDAAGPLPVDHTIVLLYSKNGMFGVRAHEIERGNRLKMTLIPDNDVEITRLRALERGERIGVAFGSAATFARVTSVGERVRGSNHQIELELNEEPIDSSFGSEMSYNGISADQIADMRARRILLNETLPTANADDLAAKLNDATLDSFVAGRILGGNRLTVAASPLPLLARAEGVTASERLEVMRLACVMLLILTGTVEHINTLNMRFIDGGIDVSFEGVRHKIYSNREAPKITVAGVCQI